MRHAEAEHAFPALSDRLLGARRAHDRGHPGGDVDRRFPALPDAGRILGRDPAAILDRFALAEQERRLLAGGLLRGQPQERAGTGRALVGDDDAPGIGTKGDDQRRAEVRILRSDLPREGMFGGIGDAVDLQPVVVEDDLFRAWPAIDVNPRRPAEPPRVEIDVEVQRDVGYARFERPCETVRIDRSGTPVPQSRCERARDERW